MKFIAHRGNVFGRNFELENHPSYILEAINLGYNVEVDIWYSNGWWLGHDNPQYKVSFLWINNHRQLWLHCKNKEALQKIHNHAINKCLNFDFLNYFWHQDDDYTVTSKGFVLIHVGKPIIRGGICVLPEKYKPSLKFKDINVCGGICSDIIGFYAHK